MGKHTPGPWFITYGYENGGPYVVRQFDGTEYITEDVRTEADARLIAAAPDMLAALELAINSPHCGYAIDAMHKAIAKAKGEA